jgi:hypothetical protein
MEKTRLIRTCLLCISVYLITCESFGSVYNLTKAENKNHLKGTLVGSLSNNPQSDKSDTMNKFSSANKVCAGVNIHFTTGHEKDLDLIAAAGFKFIRMDFVWQNIERTRGNYNWAEYDELTANLNKRGLSAIYILDYSNSLYENTVESKDPLTGEEQKGIASPQHPESIAAFASWAAASAKHFLGSNIIWEIWNEPNISFWKPKSDVDQYIALTIATCKAVKSVVPNSIIIGPGTSQIPFPFLESFLASGILEYLDAVSVHPYRDYSRSPETAGIDYQRLHELIDHYAPDEKNKIPIISSEWGYSSATRGLSTETQAAYIVRMQLVNLLYNIPVSIWYDWKNDGDDPANFEHNCGTVSSDLRPKQAYTAIQTMNAQLKDFTLICRIELNSENDYVLLFKNDAGTYKMIAWTMDDSHSVIIDKIVPKVVNSTVTDWKGDNLQLKYDEDKLVLDLNDLPQYINLPSGFCINKNKIQ